MARPRLPSPARSSARPPRDPASAGARVSRPLVLPDHRAMLSTHTASPSFLPTISRATGQGAGASRRLLVVDDEAAIRTAVSRYLERLGYEVHTAGGVPEALDRLGRQKFVAMLCDVRMPDVDGVAGLPRALAIDPELAVVMLSGVNDAPTATAALAGGALDYLVKPVELPDLARAL